MIDARVPHQTVIPNYPNGIYSRQGRKRHKSKETFYANFVNFRGNMLLRFRLFI